MASDPFALPAFVLSIVSLIVAAVGAATGIAALVWQVLTRTRGAHRVVVRATPNMMVYTPGSEPLGPYVQVEIMNRGASAVQVQNWSVALPGGRHLMVAVPAAFPPSPPLPYLLHAGTSVSFYSLLSDLQDELTESDAPRARAAAHLATGEKILGRKGELATSRDKVESSAVG